MSPVARDTAARYKIDRDLYLIPDRNLEEKPRSGKRTRNSIGRIPSLDEEEDYSKSYANRVKR